MNQQVEFIQLRTMTENDSRLFADWEQAERPYPWNESHFNKSLATEASEAYVLEIKNEPCGFYVLQRVGEEGYLLNLMVRRDLRRRGFGARLMERVIHQCGRDGIKTLFLDVENANIPALELYKKSGFGIIQVRPQAYPDGQGATLMKREIGKS